jgi:hypothetical protein
MRAVTVAAGRPHLLHLVITSLAGLIYMVMVALGTNHHLLIVVKHLLLIVNLVN